MSCVSIKLIKKIIVKSKNFKNSELFFLETNSIEHGTLHI